MAIDEETQADLDAIDANGHTPVPLLDSQGPRNPLSTPSVVDLFKAEQAELVSAKDIKIPVKGYELTGLQIQYHMPVDVKELDRIGAQIRKQYKDQFSQNLYMSMDTMIHLCDGLYVQPDGVEEPVMLDPEEVGEPVQFDHRLAAIMGMENPEQATARQVVKRLFGNKDLMVIAHAERLNRWLQNVKADLTSEVWQLGE